MSDRNLEGRAGRNVGIEPTLLPFVQAGAAEVVALKPSGDTVLAENNSSVARVALGCGTPDLGGYLYNTGSSPADVDFLFVDEDGNEVSLTGGLPIPILGSGPTPISFDDVFKFFCLAPGEKIVARAIPPGDPRSIMGQDGLIGWWRADAVDASPTSSATDLSGNGHTYTQPIVGQRPAIVVGANGKPAWNMVSANLSGLGTAGLTIALGSRPCSFVVAQSLGPHNDFAIACLTGLSTDVGKGFFISDAFAPFFPGFTAGGRLTDGGSGLVQTVAPADNALHLMEVLPFPAPTGFALNVDGAQTTSVKSGGMETNLDIDFIGYNDAIRSPVGWGGLIYDRWITKAVPTAAQLQRLSVYYQRRYLGL